MKHEIMAAIYDLSQAIYTGNATLKECKSIISKVYGINENSFTYYYYAFKHMLDGSCYTRGINVELRDYMLTRIRKDYGYEQYKIAVNAYWMFIEYDETHKRINKIKERMLYAKHLNIIKTYNNNGQ